MPELVPLELVKSHLRISSDLEDDDLNVKLEIAQEVVLDYVRQWVVDDGSPTWAATVDGWDIETVPKRVQAAIVAMTSHLYRFRDDDEARDQPKAPHGMLPMSVVNLLHRLRDPALR